MKTAEAPTSHGLNLNAKTLASSRKSYKKSHFSFAFFFLEPQRKEALSVLYQVCRVLDDAVDTKAVENPHHFLEAWRTAFSTQQSEPLKPFQQEELASRFLTVAKTYKIPLSIMLDLIDKGVAVDLNKNRFETPMETESYCYGVAGTVGMACLPIFGVPLEQAREFGIRLGIAVQWVNLIRDVGVDSRLGRIYLPLDHLEQFGYTEHDLLNGVDGQSFKKLMAHEAETARQHFKRAQELLPKEWHETLLPARIMGNVYLDLLKKIERRGFPVFKQNIRLNYLEKGLSVLKEIRNKGWSFHT